MYAFPDWRAAPAENVPAALADWLCETGSLTERLIACRSVTPQDAAYAPLRDEFHDLYQVRMLRESRVFDDVHALFRKGWRRSDPKGYWIGPKCGEAVKRTGLKLREPGHKGRTYGVWR